MQLHKRYHTYIECIPISEKQGAFQVPGYFKKAMLEQGSEWNQNPKLIQLSETRTIRHAIPKGFAYFHVDFGSIVTSQTISTTLSTSEFYPPPKEQTKTVGYAHTIENERKFPRCFAHEILGSMLDVHPGEWLKPKFQPRSKQIEQTQKFIGQWKEYLKQ